MEDNPIKEQGTPTPAPTPTPNPEPKMVSMTQEAYDKMCADIRRSTEERTIKKYGLADEDGNKIDIKALKEEWNNENRKVLEAQIRADIERKNKMSAEEALKAEREEFEASKKQYAIDRNQQKARDMMEKADFDDGEIDILVSLVDDNDESLAKIVDMCSHRKDYKNNVQNNVINEINKNGSTIKVGQNQTITKEQVANMGLTELTKFKRENPALYAQLMKS